MNIENDIEDWDETLIYLPREPEWIFHWGNLIVFAFLIVLIILAQLISYNNTLSAKVLISSLLPTIEIRTKNDGNLSKIMFQPGDTVKANSRLAVLSTPTNVEDIRELKAGLLKEDTKIGTYLELARAYPVHQLGLDLQPLYNDYLTSFSRVLQSNEKQPKDLTSEVYNLDIRKQMSSIKALNNQQELIEDQMNLAQKELDRYESLYAKGVISLQDLEQKQIHFYERLNAQKDGGKVISELSLEKSAIEKRKMIFESQFDLTHNGLLYDLSLARQALISGIEQWEDQYILKSPIDGRISYFDFWGDNQWVEQGQLIFVIAPIKLSSIIAKCEVPIYNSGMLKIGQSVLISLENYPSKEWGKLSGTVKSISDIPKNNSNPVLVVYLSIESSETNYGKFLDLKYSSSGEAVILLEEHTLLERIFYQFKDLWSSNKNE